MSSVTVGGPGFVGVGGRSPECEVTFAAAWTSVYGLTWTRASVAGTLDLSGGGNHSMASVTVGGPGLLAVGADGPGAALWASVDGFSWSRAGSAPDQHLNSVAASGSRLVSVGSAESGNAAVLTSEGGLVWEPVSDDQQVFGGDGRQSMLSVAAVGSGFVAVGSDGPDAAVWVATTDGATPVRAPSVIESAGEVGAAEAGADDAGDSGSGGTKPQLPLEPGSLARLDPETNELTNAIATDMGSGSDRFGYFPVVAVGRGEVWAIDRNGGRTLTQIDPQTNAVRRTVDVVGSATDIALAGDSLWLTSSLGDESVLVELAADTGRFRRAVTLGYSELVGLAAGGEGIWVIARGEGGHVAVRIEPATGAVVAKIPLSAQAWDVALGEGAVWFLGGGSQEPWEVGRGRVWRIDPRTNAVVDTLDVPDGVDRNSRIATGAGALWLTGGLLGTVLRIDPPTARIVETIPVRDDVGAVTVGRGSVWVLSEAAAAVLRIDPATSEVVARTAIWGECACSVAVGAGGVWATS